MSSIALQLAEEKDKNLRWRLIIFSILEGLQEAESFVEDPGCKKIFVRDLNLMLKWVKDDNLNELYEFFTLA